MPMGMKNPLLLMGGDFEFYCLQLKNPVGILKILMLFPVGMRVQCSFPMGIFRVFFSPGTNFRPIFPVGRGSNRICHTGVFKF